MNANALLSILMLTALCSHAQVDNSIIRAGVKLNLKSNTKVGSNATIARYCDTKSKNCEELLITNDQKSISMPMTSGPVYNIIKTGKTANYTGMTKYVSANNKLTHFYNISGNTQTIITPIKKSFIVSIFQFGNSDKGIKSNNNVFKSIGVNQDADVCNCIAEWEGCYLDLSLNNPDQNSENLNQALIQICDANFELCKRMCVINHGKSGIILYRNIIVNNKIANNFQITISE